MSTPDSLQTTIVNILEAKPGWRIILQGDSRTNALRVHMIGLAYGMDKFIPIEQLDADRTCTILKAALEEMEQQIEQAEPPEQGID